jgi:response regulator of citrate/malate metabolism
MKNKITAKDRILEEIKNSIPSYVTIQEIADKTKISRDTVSKYILVLAAEGKIRVTKKVGKVNLYEAVK